MSLILVTQLINAGFAIFSLIASYVILSNGFLTRYRIQQKPDRLGSLVKRLPLVSFNVLLVAGLSSVSLLVLEPWFETNRFPPVWVLLLQVSVITVLDDTWFYFSHRFLHRNKFLLQCIHRKHHETHTPVPVDYLYVHPLDWLLCSPGLALGILVVIAIAGQISAWSFWTYSCIRILNEINVHSGLRSAFRLRIPFWASAEHHDLHHSKPVGNYGSTLKIWDKILGTEIK
jgi:sterol desaturase/sphingolipid hydroxylase (fatty acid hydroxylase superfamily)